MSTGRQCDKGNKTLKILGENLALLRNSRVFFETLHIRVDAMSRAGTEKLSPGRKRCLWEQDYAHLVKQAQKPNVNRKEGWEGEEEEGNGAAHIPVNKDKSCCQNYCFLYECLCIIVNWRLSDWFVYQLCYYWNLGINKFAYVEHVCSYYVFRKYNII